MKTRIVNIATGADFDVYIGRPGPWGNPFSHLDKSRAQYHVKSRSEAIAKFENWLLSQPELVERARRELTGKVLGCYCGAGRCHGDVLVRICDGEPEGFLFANVREG